MKDTERIGVVLTHVPESISIEAMAKVVGAFSYAQLHGDASRFQVMYGSFRAASSGNAALLKYIDEQARVNERLLGNGFYVPSFVLGATSGCLMMFAEAEITGVVLPNIRGILNGYREDKFQEVLSAPVDGDRLQAMMVFGRNESFRSSLLGHKANLMQELEDRTDGVKSLVDEIKIEGDTERDSFRFGLALPFHIFGIYNENERLKRMYTAKAMSTQIVRRRKVKTTLVEMAS